jgi:hypothetical protein
MLYIFLFKSTIVKAGGKLLATCFLAHLIFSTLKMEAICPSLNVG